MNRIIHVSIMVLIILTGCSTATGKASFMDEINAIEQSIEQDDWKSVQKKGEELFRIYEKNRWKIQLLGDEGEYEKLYESINRFIAAIKEKDVVNAKVELASVRTMIEDIYSL